MEGLDVVAANFPYTRTVRFIETRRNPRMNKKVVKRATHHLNINYLLNLDLHTKANNFAPNESKRLSISPVLLFTKDQIQGWKIVVVIAKEKK